MSAIAILVSGLILGLMFMYFVGRRRAAAAAAAEGPDLALRDLEGRREALIAQIRELDDLASKLTPAEVAEQRTRLELETAQVLRAIDVHRRSEPKRQPSERPAPDTVAPAPVPYSSATAGFAWGATLMLALVTLVYFVVQSMKPREANGSVTGNLPPRQGAAPQQNAAQSQAEAETLRLESAVKQEPNNLDLRIELARAYLERENLMAVYDQTQFVLTKKPNEPRALTYQGLVRLAMGQGTEAVKMLETATKVDPKLLDAWVALAWARTQEGNTAAAEKAIQSAAREHPDEKQRLDTVFTQMKSRGAAMAAAPQQAPQEGGPEGAQAATGSLPPGHPPVTADSPRVGPVTTAARPSQGVRITVDTAGAMRSGTLFVFARAAGVAAGPPVAVKRMNISSLPITIELTSADSMMGQQLPPTLRVEARLDSDGNAATKNAADPKAVQDGVAVGSAIRLGLQ